MPLFLRNHQLEKITVADQYIVEAAAVDVSPLAASGLPTVLHRRRTANHWHLPFHGVLLSRDYRFYTRPRNERRRNEKVVYRSLLFSFCIQSSLKGTRTYSGSTIPRSFSIIDSSGCSPTRMRKSPTPSIRFRSIVKFR